MFEHCQGIKYWRVFFGSMKKEEYPDTSADSNKARDVSALFLRDLHRTHCDNKN
jgi:hypothetical protein